MGGILAVEKPVGGLSRRVLPGLSVVVRGEHVDALATACRGSRTQG
jgi:hypothetical protein